MIPGWIYGFSLFRGRKNAFSIKQKVTSLKNPTQCRESLSSKKPIWRLHCRWGSQTTFSEGILISMHTLWLQCKLQCEMNEGRRRRKWDGEKLIFPTASETHIASFATTFTPPSTNDDAVNFIKCLLNCILIWNISQVTRFVVVVKINLFREVFDGKAICLRHSLLHKG